MTSLLSSSPSTVSLANQRQIHRWRSRRWAGTPPRNAHIRFGGGAGVQACDWLEESEEPIGLELFIVSSKGYRYGQVLLNKLSKQFIKVERRRTNMDTSQTHRNRPPAGHGRVTGGSPLPFQTAASWGTRLKRPVSRSGTPPRRRLVAAMFSTSTRAPSDARAHTHARTHARR